MERKWGNGERLTLYISSFSLYFLPLSPFPPSLSISYIKMRHILLQNVKYGTFVANVTKISTYALWGNNSGSNLLRGSSAICAGLSLSRTSNINLYLRIITVILRIQSWLSESQRNTIPVPEKTIFLRLEICNQSISMKSPAKRKWNEEHNKGKMILLAMLLCLKTFLILKMFEEFGVKTADK